MEDLKDIVVNLLIENNKLKKELEKSKESSTYWFEKFYELDKKNQETIKETIKD
ncbi:hypothetical protein [Seonamhaeicola sp.]|uniref:hypothetical protein n=1 Tax=Seonamhaeicola sp. TaxID=1912245 RepID=UPI0035645A5E